MSELDKIDANASKFNLILVAKHRHEIYTGLNFVPFDNRLQCGSCPRLMGKMAYCIISRFVCKYSFPIVSVYNLEQY